MPTFSTIKRGARDALRGNWGKATLLMLLSCGIAFLSGALQSGVTNLFAPSGPLSVAGGADVYELLYTALTNLRPVNLVIFVAFVLLNACLLAPLNLGISYWCLGLYTRKPSALPEAFRYFESGGRYLRAMWLELNMAVRNLLWAVVFFAAPSAVYFFSLRELIRADEAEIASQSAMATAGLLISSVLLLLAMLFYSATMNRYFLTAYLLCEDDGLSVRGAIKLSVAYTKGFRFSILGFQLSFILWFILFGILNLFTQFYAYPPHYYPANALYARCLLDKNRAETRFDATREFQVGE